MSGVLIYIGLKLLLLRIDLIVSIFILATTKIEKYFLSDFALKIDILVVILNI